MSGESIKKVLKDIGLTEKEIEVYTFLARHNALKGKEIAKQTRIDNAEIYRILRSLQRKGILVSTLEGPARFEAVPLDKVIDEFVKAKRDEAALVEDSKQALMDDWAKISKPNSQPEVEKFVVLEGQNKIYPRIFQLIKETKSQLSIILDAPDLIRAYKLGLFDALLKHPLRSKIRLRFLTEFPEKNDGPTMNLLLKRITPNNPNFEGRTPNLGLRLSPRMVIRDDQEILFFITPKEEKTSAIDQIDSCLWTNCKTLVQSFTTVFADLWENSTQIEKKMLDIETGKPVPTLTICDTETVKKKYDEVLSTAREEIIMLTSWEGITELSEKTSQLETWAEKGVSVRVMAPITDLKIAEQLSTYCDIKNTPETQLRTTMIDGQHLFQFRDARTLDDTSKSTPHYDTAIYTNRYENVQTTKDALIKIWKKARSPSLIAGQPSSNNPKTAVGSLWEETDAGRQAYRCWLYHLRETERGRVTEKDIINKIITAKRLTAKDPMKDMNIQYGSKARAIIHPPSHFNLPDMIITACHDNKYSSFGAEDRLEISLWLQTPKGYAFVIVAHVTDSPKAAEWRKGVLTGTPAAHNGVLVRKNQLKVTLQGNTLFAGWTVPIPLLPPKYILPPACILYEGYGKLDTYITRTSLPSGRTQLNERNEFKAFVTFYHPASTYQGPGTDGYFDREYVMTAYPPSTNPKNQ